MNIVDFGDGRCTVTEASNWLRVSRETIYNWEAKGRISYVEGTKFFLATDLDQIRHERVVAAGKELVRLQAVPSLA
jgi:predicted site-specific integrase-resolvase